MATPEMVVVSGRDATDTMDRFTALDPTTGERLWVYEYPAPAELDYGNSPRATPILTDGILVTFGATGILTALDAQAGVPLWSASVVERFNVPVPTWGFSGSPLVVDDRIYIPLGDRAWLVALDLISGETVWTVPASASAYASLMPFGSGGVLGVGRDGYFLRHRDNGEVNWTHQLRFAGDFGVPTPVLTPDGAIFTGENNGVLLFGKRDNTLMGNPLAVAEDAIPDSHTPVLVDGLLLVAHRGLRALDVRSGLSERWVVARDAIRGYASIIASKDRALVTTESGQLLLVALDGDKGVLLDRRSYARDRVYVLSHPAIVNDRLVVRMGKQVSCYHLPQ